MPSGGQHIDKEERKELIKEVYEQDGIPPSPTRVSEYSERSNSYYESYLGKWSDIVADAGVPTVEEVVADTLLDAMTERLETYPWKDSLRFHSGLIHDRTGIGRSRIGRAIEDIHDGEVSTKSSEKFSLETEFGSTSPGRQSWRVRPVERPDGDGSTKTAEEASG